MTFQEHAYQYFTSDLRRAGVFEHALLAETTERHRTELDVPPLSVVFEPAAEVSRTATGGAVFELAAGLPSERHLRIIDRVVRGGRRAWLYWPAEHAVECVDRERLDSLRQHVKAVRWLKRICEPADRAIARWQRAPAGLRWIYRGEFPVRRSDIASNLDFLIMKAQRVPLDPLDGAAQASRFGIGLYLRTDYWATASDDDRASRVIAGLAATSERLFCLISGREGFHAPAGVQKVVMDAPRITRGEDAIVRASRHYLPIVKAVCQTLRPAYLYDRMSAGQSVGAELSQSLAIPYIVEYPGSEAVLREALGGQAPRYTELYSRTEELALRQATGIVVPSQELKDHLVSRGIAANRVLAAPGGECLGPWLVALANADDAEAARISTGDADKDQVQDQWNRNPVGSHYARKSQPHTLEWFREVETHRYGAYAPWMPQTMEFALHAGHDVLEVGGGLGTDLAQFAAHGAKVTDVDLAAGHLRLAEENFRLRGLRGRFIHHDAESLPFPDGSFDLVYSNGVLHHTPNTAAVVREIYRVLRPGGRAIVMLYAENSLHYWRKLVWELGIKEGLLEHASMGEIMSRSVERSATEARPLVKVYTKPRARRLFKDFDRIEVVQRQLLAEELPAVLRWTRPIGERTLGWNLVIKAIKRSRTKAP